MYRVGGVLNQTVPKSIFLPQKPHLSFFFPLNFAFFFIPSLPMLYVHFVGPFEHLEIIAELISQTFY